MEKLKIHSEGQKDHLKSLRKRYTILKNALKQDSTLSNAEKRMEIKKIKRQFVRENKSSNQNLY